jgi:pimeloyl-ACP methyl ester carboxylesterase
MGSQPIPVTLVCQFEMIARGFLAAARFLLVLSGGWTSAARWQRQVLTRFNTDIDLYLPRGTSAGTVIFVHGLSVLGHRDPRVEQLGSALATAGFRAVIPAIKSLRELWIQRDQPEQIEQLITAITSDEQLVPGGCCALMAVSFSGVFVLRAAGRPAVSARLSALGLIGAYADVNSVCDFLVTANRADPYGYLLMLRSYYAEFETPSARFLEALERCIEHSIAESEAESFEGILDASQPDEKQLIQLIADPRARADMGRRMRSVFDADWRDYEVPIESLQLDVPVFLIHGRDDRVIPVEQSRDLADRLDVRGVVNRLCVTRFLSHGDSRIRWRELLEVLRVWCAFAWFFRCCQVSAKHQPE